MSTVTNTINCRTNELDHCDRYILVNMEYGCISISLVWWSQLIAPVSVVLNQGWFFPQGTFGNIWRYFWLLHWVETRNAGEQPIMHRTVPTTKHYHIENVNSAKAEKHSFIHSRNKSHRTRICARHCARFWEPRHEGQDSVLQNYHPQARAIITKG